MQDSNQGVLEIPHSNLSDTALGWEEIVDNCQSAEVFKLTRLALESRLMPTQTPYTSTLVSQVFLIC